MFIYHIQYQDQASSHLMTSKHQSIYCFLHFSWSAHINKAYSKVLNIDAHAQKMKKLQKKTFEHRFTDFHMLNAWNFCDNHTQDYSFRWVKESVEKWLIDLILKDVKSCFDDDFWVRTNMSLRHLMSWTWNLCQNRLLKFEFHSLITVSSQKSHKSHKLLSVRWSYAMT